MRLIIALEYRFDRTPDGAVWTQTAFPHSFWARYLEIFDHVHVVARTHQVALPPDGAQRTDGDLVTFATLPYYMGPWQYLRSRGQLRSAVINTIKPNDAILLRVPSPIALNLQSYLEATKRPYAVQVVGDPADVFAPGAVSHPLRPFFPMVVSTLSKTSVQVSGGSRLFQSDAAKAVFVSGFHYVFFLTWRFQANLW